MLEIKNNNAYPFIHLIKEWYMYLINMLNTPQLFI